MKVPDAAGWGSIVALVLPTWVIVFRASAVLAGRLSSGGFQLIESENPDLQLGVSENGDPNIVL